MFVQIAATALIAFYAMFGGAFLSAAITSPRNCLIAISHLWSDALTWFFGGVVFIVLGVLMMAALQSTIPSSMIWLGLAHCVWFALLLASRRIAESIIDHDRQNDGEGETSRPAHDVAD